MKQFAGVYQGRQVLITGHTGFKGSWLSLWLTELGAHVNGIALDPETIPNHWDLLNLSMADNRADIRDADTVSALVRKIQPEIVFHMAAQPLVRRSYRDPLQTWSTNVMGTANVLEACRQNDSVKAIVVITTDKVYENQEWLWGYRENDRLGGHDPYSASKAATELLAESYRRSFFTVHGSKKMATARAGNVIGGGDWSEDRLIPDLFRAVDSGKALQIRSPKASRPWQHVLECLSGYLLLGQKLLAGDQQCTGAWNFGPDNDSNRTVEEVLIILRQHWSRLNWNVVPQDDYHEMNLLYLDSSNAKKRLGWKPVWTLQEALAATAEWYDAYMTRYDAVSRKQLASFIATAHSRGACWVDS